MKIEIVPSGRIDYCCECKTDHGYDCPKDMPNTKEEECNAETNGVKCRPPCKLCYGGEILTPSSNIKEEKQRICTPHGLPDCCQESKEDSTKEARNRRFVNEIASQLNVSNDTINAIRLFRKELPAFITSEVEFALEQQRKEIGEKCRQIFIEEVDWSEWGMDSDEAGEKFDEAFSKLEKE